MKIKIAVYVMPMLFFGVLFIFFKSRTYKGVGNILLGLGFIFLGISFMKDGFEPMKGGIDLASFAIDGALAVEELSKRDSPLSIFFKFNST